MRIVVAGAGSVGRSIAHELAGNGHDVLVIEKDPKAAKSKRLETARWMHADACEFSALSEANLEETDVVVAATGDDKANLVVSFLAKTEFGVPRTVARVNNPRNEWMFDDSWGVDVAVSTPRLMTALVEEAVAVGDLVQMFTFREGGTVLVEFTLPVDSPVAGTTVGQVDWPRDTVLVAIIRDGRPIAPSPDDTLEIRDELLLLSTNNDEAELRETLSAAYLPAKSAVGPVAVNEESMTFHRPGVIGESHLPPNYGASSDGDESTSTGATTGDERGADDAAISRKAQDAGNASPGQTNPSDGETSET